MVDLDSIMIATCAITNITSFVHTLQEMRAYPESGILRDYRNFLSWALGEGRNPEYRPLLPQNLVGIPLSGPGVVLANLIKGVINHYRTNNSNGDGKGYALPSNQNL